VLFRLHLIEIGRVEEAVGRVVEEAIYQAECFENLRSFDESILK